MACDHFHFSTAEFLVCVFHGSLVLLLMNSFFSEFALFSEQLMDEILCTPYISYAFRRAVSISVHECVLKFAVNVCAFENILVCCIFHLVLTFRASTFLLLCAIIPCVHIPFVYILLCMYVFPRMCFSRVQLLLLCMITKFLYTFVSELLCSQTTSMLVFSISIQVFSLS